MSKQVALLVFIFVLVFQLCGCGQGEPGLKEPGFVLLDRNEDAILERLVASVLEFDQATPDERRIIVDSLYEVVVLYDPLLVGGIAFPPLEVSAEKGGEVGDAQRRLVYTSIGTIAQLHKVYGDETTERALKDLVALAQDLADEAPDRAKAFREKLNDICVSQGVAMPEPPPANPQRPTE